LVYINIILKDKPITINSVIFLIKKAKMDPISILEKIQSIRSALDEIEIAIGMKGYGINSSKETFPKGDFDKIKSMLMSNDWPVAVDPELICDENNEQDKMNRAQGIVRIMIAEPVVNKKILDFGTGEGHVIHAAAENHASYAIGYDITNKFIPKNLKNMEFTSEWRIVQEQAPYDIIIASDVLDHLVGIEPIEALKKMKTVLKDDGKVYLRYHNYMSRHGTHMYKHINKAFIHLIFTEAELALLMPNVNFISTIKTYFPIKTYLLQLEGAGFKIDNEYKSTTDIEEFFEQNELTSRIFSNTPYKSFPKTQMELDFIDYRLTK